MRTEFSAKTKEQAFVRCGGFCEDCGVKFGPSEPPQYDHIIADALNGLNDLENCQCLCSVCHRAKTNRDVKMISKAKRIERKQINAIKRKSRPILGSKASGIRKRMDGTVERR